MEDNGGVTGGEMSFTVIIPSRNIDNLVPCVGAVRKHEPGARVIVVDDQIGNEYSESGAMYQECLRLGVDWARGIKPFVFSRNINCGIEATREAIEVTTMDAPVPEFIPGPYRDVILLNDDALLTTPGGFTALAAVAADHPEYGVIAAACDNTGNPNQRPRGIGLREDPRMVCFVCVYIPRRTIERVGLLDERYVGYGMDDDDYCFSVRKAGLKVGIFDHCIVDHRHLTSSFRGNPRAPSDFRPNMRVFIDKWGTDNWGFPREVALRRWGQGAGCVSCDGWTGQDGGGHTPQWDIAAPHQQNSVEAGRRIRTSVEARVKLNLGASDRQFPGFLSVDIAPPADQIADLSKPWPWPDSSVDEVRAHDIFEHLPDRIQTMNELWRVLRPGGTATIEVPSAVKGAGFAQDPTHKSAWCMNSFQYFEHGSFATQRLALAYGIKARFKVVSLTEREYQDAHEKVWKIMAVLQAVK